MSRFNTVDFTSTRFTTAVQKQNFAEKLAQFVEGGFKPGAFTKRIYKELSNCFGHIAHFNRNGFYQEWFEDKTAQLRWVDRTIRAPVHGSPENTLCDVELAFQKWLSGTTIPGDLRKARDDQEEKNERADLAWLKAKYE